MSNTLSRILSIQSAAGGMTAEQVSIDMATSTKAAESKREPVEEGCPAWPRAEIIAALEQGASSKALLLSLQAIAALTGDRAFGAEAQRLASPAQPAEAWKRAWKTWSRYEEQIRAAGRNGDLDTAHQLFDTAGREVCEIFSGIVPGDIMSEQLALAVYEGLSRAWDEGSAEASSQKAANAPESA